MSLEKRDWFKIRFSSGNGESESCLKVTQSIVEQAVFSEIVESKRRRRQLSSGGIPVVVLSSGSVDDSGPSDDLASIDVSGSGISSGSGQTLPTNQITFENVTLTELEVKPCGLTPEFYFGFTEFGEIMTKIDVFNKPGDIYFPEWCIGLNSTKLELFSCVRKHIYETDSKTGFFQFQNNGFMNIFHEKCLSENLELSDCGNSVDTEKLGCGLVEIATVLASDETCYSHCTSQNKIQNSNFTVFLTESDSCGCSDSNLEIIEYPDCTAENMFKVESLLEESTTFSNFYDVSYRLWSNGTTHEFGFDGITTLRSKK